MTLYWDLMAAEGDIRVKMKTWNFLSLRDTNGSGSEEFVFS